MTYFAIIGDIVDSKELSERRRHQKELQDCLDVINQTYSSVIASKFSITLGDEFQGLLSLDAPIFHIIDIIRFSLPSINLRFGVGQGEILTEINPDLSIGADGPAYWLAREAITYVHQKNDYGNTQVCVRLADKEAQEIINSLISASEAIKSNWRESQASLLHALLDIGTYEEHFDQQELGNRVSLTSSALSKRLKSSNLKVYLRSRNSALHLMSSCVREVI
ncbi:SatD family protein [Streptococcus caprae]|uniref:SatD family protein n=1 Tax=Streptococcus caprae TaxID=1640501 RepID=A0ABV8CY26_9STRE